MLIEYCNIKQFIHIIPTRGTLINSTFKMLAQNLFNFLWKNQHQKLKQLFMEYIPIYI